MKQMNNHSRKNSGCVAILLAMLVSSLAEAEMLPLAGPACDYEDTALWRDGVVDNVITGDVLSAATTITVNGDIQSASGFLVNPSSAYSLKFVGSGRKKALVDGVVRMQPASKQAISFGERMQADTQIDFVAVDGKPLNLNFPGGGVTLHGAVLKGKGVSLTANSRDTNCGEMAAVDCGGGELEVVNAMMNLEAAHWIGSVEGIGCGRGLGNVSSVLLDVMGGLSVSSHGSDLSTTSLELQTGAFFSDSTGGDWGALEVCGPAMLCGKATFASYVSRGAGVGTLVYSGSSIKFRDPSGILLVGGNDTIDAPGPQIKVAPLFHEGNSGRKSSNLAFGGGQLMTYEAEKGLVPIPASSMRQGFAGVGNLDNVYVADNMTLDEDVTCNAVLVENGKTLNLGGHTLTLNSGAMIATYGTMNSTNGSVRIAQPLSFWESTNNTTTRNFWDRLETVGNTDRRKVMFYCWGVGGAQPAISDWSGYVGAVAAFSNSKWTTLSLPGSMCTTNITLEVSGGTDYSLKLFNGNWQLRRLYSLGGNICFTGNLGCGLYLGCGDEDSNREWDEFTANSSGRYKVVVGKGGILALGAISRKGLRRGNLCLAYGSDTVKEFTMKDGGTIEATVYKEGPATALITGEISVTLAGRLDVHVDASRIAAQTSWPILISKVPVSGKFSSITSGFRMDYNVKQADGTYACVLAKKSDGFRISIR